MKKLLGIAPLLSIALIACGQTQNTPINTAPTVPAPIGSNVNPSSRTVVGLLEVSTTIDADGEVSTKARMMPRFQSTAIATMPGTQPPVPTVPTGPGTTIDTDTGGAGSIGFVKRNSAVLDNQIDKQRYISSIYELTNNTTSDFKNLTFYSIGSTIPSAKTGGIRTVGETPHNDVRNGAFDPIALPTYQSEEFVTVLMRPAHTPFRTGYTYPLPLNTPNTGLTVDSHFSDMQLFTEAEANAVASDARAAGILNNGDGVTTPREFVLPIGFVAKSIYQGRRISKLGCDTTVNPYCTNKGLIAFTYKIARDYTGNPDGFTPTSWPKIRPQFYLTYYVIVDEPKTRISQSPDEIQGSTIDPGNIYSRINLLRSFGQNIDEISVLPGTLFTNYPGSGLTVINTCGRYNGVTPASVKARYILSGNSTPPTGSC